MKRQLATSTSPRYRYRCGAGFSLIELMITIGIVGILIGLAAPSFNSLIIGQRLVTVANDLQYGLREARSEAVRRNAPVVLCGLSTADATTCGAGNSWAFGWVMFEDADANGVRSTANQPGTTTPLEPILATSDKNASNVMIVGEAEVGNVIRYSRDGRASNGANSVISGAGITVCPITSRELPGKLVDITAGGSPLVREFDCSN